MEEEFERLLSGVLHDSVGTNVPEFALGVHRQVAGRRLYSAIHCAVLRKISPGADPSVPIQKAPNDRSGMRFWYFS